MNESIRVEDLPVEGLTRFSDNARRAGPLEHTDVPNFIAACGDIHGYGFDADEALGDLPGGGADESNKKLVLLTRPEGVTRASKGGRVEI